MVISLWLTFMGCAGGDGKDTGRDSSPPEDTAPPIDSGPDSGDVDADGDGWTPNAGDCNDDLPHVHPGARDYCDGLDADCDGEPIPDGSCGEPSDASKMWSWSFEGSAERDGYLTQALGDVDGDGRADIEGQEYPGDGLGPFVGAHLAEIPPRNLLPALAWSADFPRWTISGPTRAGEVNGDRIDDIWVQAGSDAGYTGAVFLFFGTANGFPEENERIDLAADVVWTDTPALESAGQIDPGDFNGDGLQDAMFALRDSSESYWTALLGELSPVGGSGFSTLPRLAIAYDASGILSAGDVLTDLDGDGIDELAATTQRDHDGWGVLTVVEGEDLLAGGSVLDVGHDSWYETSEENIIQLAVQRLYGDDPDSDGDGLGDVVFAASTSTVRTLVYASGGVPTGSLNDLQFTQVTGSATDYIWPKFWGDDVDDDGVSDLVLNNNCVVASHHVAEGGSFEPQGVEGPCIQSPSGALYALTDMTGDGYADWVYNQTGWAPPDGTGETYNRSLIIEGFPIPWDDPSKW